jgi:DNA-binding transcriptional ArsR family regulator
MNGENSQDSFSKDRAELFEALGHPTRIKILELLSDSPMVFSDLKKALDIDSSGQLQFHLGKLHGLVKIVEGNYALTDEGKEATRIIASKGEVKKERQSNQSHSTLSKIDSRRAAIVGVLLVLLVAIPIISYLYITNTSLSNENEQLKRSVFIDVGNIFSSSSGDLQTCLYFYDRSEYGQSSFWLDVALGHLQDVPISLPTIGSDYDRLNITNLELIDQQLKQMKSSITSGTLSFNQIEYLKNCSSTFLYLYYSMQQPQNNIYRISDIGNITSTISVLAHANNLNNSSVPVLYFSHQICGCDMGCICSLTISLNGSSYTETLPQTFNIVYAPNGMFSYTQDHTFITSLATYHEVFISVNSSAPFNFEVSSSIEGVIINQTQITAYNTQIIPGKNLPTSTVDGQYTFDFEPTDSNATVSFNVSYIF